MFIIIYFRLGFSIVNHRLIWGKPMIVGKAPFLNVRGIIRPAFWSSSGRFDLKKTLLLGETVETVLRSQNSTLAGNFDQKDDHVQT